jgi:GntR family transcriptional regulator
MILEIDTRSGTPIYRQVMDQIRRQIMTGQLAEGEQVEQVRNLAARLKVNPMTISKAYSFLEQEGLLERRRGIGLFVERVQSDQRQLAKRQLLEEAFKAAAASAVQLGVGEAEAGELFVKFYRQYCAQTDSAIAKGEQS